MLPNDDSDWTPCTEGALSSTIERVRSQRRQTNLLQFGVSTIIGTLVLVVASFYFSPSSKNLECRDVSSMLAGYVAGDLDQESRRSIEQHLVSCEICRMKLREMQAGEMARQIVLAFPSNVYQKDLLLSATQPMPIAID